MKQSELNHLRRLLGWVRCDIGQAPAELQQTMIDVADGLGHPEISEEAKARMVETYRRAEAVPLYVRAAVKALEKALTAAGREPGAGKARATAETRANTGFDPGAGAGREPVLDDVQIERGLAEIGVYVWGQRGEDWLAGVEYLARLLRAGDISPVAKPFQNHPDAAAWPVACRDTPAAPPTPRRDDAGGAPECGHLSSTRGVQVKPASAGQAESCRPAINLQVMQEALRLMPSDEARRVAREAEAVSGTLTPEQYVGARAEAEIASYGLADGTRVERAAQMDGAYLWAVRRDGNCLGLDGHWSYEPLPSSRGDEWLALHRFPTAQAAIRALKQPRAGNDGGHLSSGNGPETRTDIGFSGGHLDADTVVLPPLPAELRDTETEARAYARSAVLANLQRRAALTDEQCIAIYDALNDFCGEVDPEEYVMPHLGWPEGIKQKAIDVMLAALAVPAQSAQGERQ